jgi:hypothetical protein
MASITQQRRNVFAALRNVGSWLDYAKASQRRKSRRRYVRLARALDKQASQRHLDAVKSQRTSVAMPTEATTFAIQVEKLGVKQRKQYLAQGYALSKLSPKCGDKSSALTLAETQWLASYDLTFAELSGREMTQEEVASVLRDFRKSQRAKRLAKRTNSVLGNVRNGEKKYDRQEAEQEAALWALEHKLPFQDRCNVATRELETSPIAMRIGYLRVRSAYRSAYRALSKVNDDGHRQAYETLRLLGKGMPDEAELDSLISSYVPADLRIVAKLLAVGCSGAEVATTLGVSRMTVHRYAKRIHAALI